MANKFISSVYITLIALLLITEHSYAQCNNLVSNGNFNAGNSGFSSDYNYCNLSNCITGEGKYAIGTTANFYHYLFAGSDHTTGTGNFLIVNGAGLPNVVIWSQTITVTPNTDYSFSAWVSSLQDFSIASHLPRLQFKINGQLIGSVFNAPNTKNNWQKFSTPAWNSNTSNTAEITILNQNTSTAGNDFGLDDINFVKLCPTNINSFSAWIESNTNQNYIVWNNFQEIAAYYLVLSSLDGTSFEERSRYTADKLEYYYPLPTEDLAKYYKIVAINKDNKSLGESLKVNSLKQDKNVLVAPNPTINKHLTIHSNNLV